MGRIVVKKIPATVRPDGVPFGFAEPVETLKDVFAIEVANFFKSRSKLDEIPNIEKFHFDDPADMEDEQAAQLATWVHIIEQYPDFMQRVPLIAITTASGQQRKLGFGNQFVGVFWNVSLIKSGTFEPFALADELVLNFEVDGVASTLTFDATQFLNINAVSAKDLSEYINWWSPELQATEYETTVNGESRTGIALQPSNPNIPAVPTSIEILSSGDLNTILGIASGTKSDSRDDPPLHRFQYAMQMTLGLDVGAESENVRKQLVDILGSYLFFYLEERDFTFFGASNMEDANGVITPQRFQIIVGETIAKGGEAEVPRPDGDGTQKIFVDRYSVPVTMLQFLDRPQDGDDQGEVTNFIDP